MKHIRIFFLVSICCFPSTGFCQWVPVDSLWCFYDCSGSIINDNIVFVTPESSLIVDTWNCHGNASYTVWLISNSFSDYNVIAACNGSPTYVYLQDVDFVSDDTIYLYSTCGPPNIFQRSTDGGNTWVQISASRPANLKFVNGRLAYGITNSNLYRFSNDSVSLVGPCPVLTSTLNYYFPDSLTGYLPYGDPITGIFKTDDGGITWNELNIDTSRAYYHPLHVVNSSVAFLRSDSGYYFKTVDGGDTWNVAFQNDSIEIYFLSDLKYYGIYYDSLQNIYYCYSDDGGLSWRQTLVPAHFAVMEIKMFNDSVGLMSVYGPVNGSPGNIILKTVNNGGVGIAEVKKDVERLDIFPNPNSGIFTISIPQEARNKHGLVSIYNYSGQVVYRRKDYFNEEKLHLDLQPARKGVYCITIDTGYSHHTGKVIFE